MAKSDDAIRTANRALEVLKGIDEALLDADLVGAGCRFESLLRCDNTDEDYAFGDAWLRADPATIVAAVHTEWASDALSLGLVEGDKLFQDVEEYAARQELADRGIDYRSVPGMPLPGVSDTELRSRLIRQMDALEANTRNAGQH